MAWPFDECPTGTGQTASDRLKVIVGNALAVNRWDVVLYAAHCGTNHRMAAELAEPAADDTACTLVVSAEAESKEGSPNWDAVKKELNHGGTVDHD